MCVDVGTQEEGIVRFADASGLIFDVLVFPRTDRHSDILVTGKFLLPQRNLVGLLTTVLPPPSKRQLWDTERAANIKIGFPVSWPWETPRVTLSFPRHPKGFAEEHPFLDSGGRRLIANLGSEFSPCIRIKHMVLYTQTVLAFPGDFIRDMDLTEFPSCTDVNKKYNQWKRDLDWEQELADHGWILEFCKAQMERRRSPNPNGPISLRELLTPYVTRLPGVFQNKERSRVGTLHRLDLSVQSQKLTIQSPISALTH
uniref:Uncharacterized protein n=1 Tax=Chromera velia CCMP2878 TaxID=1169474 RepID=A0A0G4GUT7_9ALVE|eukprot:Cvel_23479.t1-p1 / transcript=Cvel_23479.t1 / gene=Cvel_23479 / organism=Chromera_velia_CCMP2878 / gene_product=hypothetical protein / transcript_product=hypothetical protein / location=Cvel_scaffold2424:14140-14904(-) / protein_length=255 / sequence_SO=supercontig / SO=protein_coding / is_pseudo=false